ncbi:MAG: adenylate/guanylate cyclase domain-containing protein, partial [Planctomycetia bacterium]|nr:adenylate/guanylate cyclase domain-containing protein [Planctomycetia bacterium]
MSDSIEIRISDQERLLFSDEFAEPVELGRQSEGHEALYSKRFQTDRWRVAIAPLAEKTVSRRHVLIEPIPGRKARLTNQSAVVAFHLPDGSELKPGATRETMIPAFFSVGNKVVRVQPAEAEEFRLQMLTEQTGAPGRSAAQGRLPLPPLPGAGTEGGEAERLVPWIQAFVEVLQSAVESNELYRTAARSVVDLVGLDTGRALVYDKGGWTTLESGPGSGGEAEWAPSRKILDRLIRERRTFWQDPKESGMELESLAGVNLVVAAPILNRRGEVIGALYGERRPGGRSAGLPKIRKLDALLVELLASGVAAGLTRIEQEKAAVAARVQFEQFFTPELAEELAARPDLLKGRDVEVTLLFCDIRGFSRVSERVGPATTVRWIGDVMGVLSECVLAHKGVLIDYIGDELIAMWGAPKEEPDHARLACRSALDMLSILPELSERWQSVLGEPIDLGIGLNTGVAQVGNTGSHRKFKYGALGNTVNLASRVQGATKYMKTRLLVTGSTRAQLDDGFACRRLCTVGVVN